MALLIDTRTIAPRDREESLYEGFLHADVPRRLALSRAALGSTQIEGWMLGTLKLFCPTSPGLNVLRAPTRGSLEPIVALCLQERGTGRFVQDGERATLVPGDLIMVRPTSSNEFLIMGTTVAFELPFDEVGLSVETLRTASDRLAGSPLFSLVCGHLASVRHDAEKLSSSVAAGNVASATNQLVRALILSAAEDDRQLASALADALLPRVLAYVRQHLTDSDLTPASIARAHNISVRSLYKLCEAANIRLAEWIISQRLEGARRNLSGPDQPARTVASVAYKWGFKDPSHFSSRFRQAYGLSPREILRHSLRTYREQV